MPSDEHTNGPAQQPDIEAFIHSAFTALIGPESMPALDDQTPPKIDRTATTVFLGRTLARALSPRARKRGDALRQMEQLLLIRERGPLGMKGHILGSIARKYPVSHSAMTRELRGMDTTNLVEVAEQVELGLHVIPRMRRPGRQR